MTNTSANAFSMARQETNIRDLEKLSSDATAVTDAAHQRLHRRVFGKSASPLRNKKRLRIRLPGDTKFSLHHVIPNSFSSFTNLASLGGTGFIFSVYRSDKTAQVLTFTVLRTGSVIIC